MTQLSTVVMGDEILLAQCCDTLLARGHAIAAVVTGAGEIQRWAIERGLTVIAPGPDLSTKLSQLHFDWLLSIANRALIPAEVIAQARVGAINFHDGPLPEYAGLNAPVWSLIEGKRRHAVTWHLMETGLDTGDIVLQRDFDISEGETALTLNTRCMAAGAESFGELLVLLESGTPPRRATDAAARRWYGRDKRPAAGGRLDFTRDADALCALVRGLDHGGYVNPLLCPSIRVGDRVIRVGAADPAGADSDAGADRMPGKVLSVTADSLTVTTGSTPLRLSRLTDAAGQTIDPTALISAGDRLPSPEPQEAAALETAMAQAAPAEPAWRRALRRLAPVGMPLARPGGTAGTQAAHVLSLPAGMTAGQIAAATAAWAVLQDGAGGRDLALCDDGVARMAGQAPGHIAQWVPLRPDMTSDFAAAADAMAARLAAPQPGFLCDIVQRDPLIGPDMPALGLAVATAGAIPGCAATVVLEDDGATLIYDTGRLDAAAAKLIAARLEHLAKAAVAAPDTALRDLPIAAPAEQAQMLQGGTAIALPQGRDACIHHAIEAQAERTPEATALIFEDQQLSYGALEARANRAAHVLRQMGVGPGVPVGLYCRRSFDLVVGALAILKAGGAYVPLDPGYPADRIAHYIADSAAPVIVTQSEVVRTLPAHAAALLHLDADPRLAGACEGPPQSGVTPEDLAYLIYTSGSTGTPKGVMVEHRNVANFFAGMDERIAHDPPGTWLAVTSLSFDISVLELFWTLARGFRVVLAGDDMRAAVSAGEDAPRGGIAVSSRPMDFSLYYWGNDDGVGPDKYKLLLEGAKHADAHGFCAVWTPERHFHAFGGPYPNPSVTGAAVAAVTRNIGVRAGSCVAPLHHTARIAEEWAVIDNLTNGRAGLAIASGWQPDDFVLRPENTPPDNKPATQTSIDQLRRLWRGEAVGFPRRDGSLHPVVTQPRPVSPEPALWVTTAGNPATWQEAGALGANVLTHLLGQSIDEVGEKIALYHEALRNHGHDPANFTVTLMLHSFLAADRDTARETARGPMKAYLRAAAGLIKQYAWAFPAFKKPVGANSPADIDLSTLDEDEMEGVLEFAFQRYFEESGLFGTVEDGLRRVEQLKRIGVDEVACLIDYGIAVETVLEGLAPLADLLRRANTPTRPAEQDFSIAAQIQRHGVTHLQCTPSMARLLTMDDTARAAMAGIRHLMVGGEALPGPLAADLARLTGAPPLNMYGPTETTIWSSVGPARGDGAIADLGTPIANTRLYVLDEALKPVPTGLPGELCIAGAGVTRGYWGRDALTAERFPPDPFAEGRMYRTGDLVRRDAGGRLHFLGRTDHQIKIRGYRVELGEIEARLESLPGVRQAVVVGREDGPGDLRLIAHVTPAGAAAEADLRAQLAETLPDYMIPARIVAHDAMPLTPNGKIDRAALPDAGVAPPPPTAPITPPEQGLQARIAEIWARILGLDSVGRDDNFFALGGHSLLAVQAHREIRTALNTTRLSITDIFRFPTLSGLAAHLETTLEADSTPAAAAPGASMGNGGAAPAGADTGTGKGDDAATRARARQEAMAKRRALRARRGAPGA